MALGHLLGSAACIVESVGLAPMASDIRAFVPSLETLMQDLLPSSPQARNAAKRIALRLLDTVPFVYAPRPMRSAATRWQTQINENSKMLCLSGEVPEMDHNQIVGRIDGARDGRNRPVMLLPRSGGYMALDLMRATIELFDDHDIDTVVADLEGASPLECALHGIMLGDFVSYYLAILRGVDPTPVPSIRELKAIGLVASISVRSGCHPGHLQNFRGRAPPLLTTASSISNRSERTCHPREIM